MVILAPINKKATYLPNMHSTYDGGLGKITVIDNISPPRKGGREADVQ